MAVSGRTFGVEIECTYGARPSKKSDVYERIRHAERDTMRLRAIKEIKAHKEFSRWGNHIGIDGSGIEIRSPILKGQEGIEELAGFFEYLNSIGSTVTNQDGMHVHHGAEDFAKDWVALYNVCASWGKWTKVIHSMVAKRRRNGNMCRDAFNNDNTLKSLERACLTSPDEHARLVKKYNDAVNRYYAGAGNFPGGRALPQNPAAIGGRGAFNLSNIGGVKNTIEIRLAEGMMDTNAAVAWVKFGQRFLDYVVEKEEVIKGSPLTLNVLLKKLELDESDAEVLKAKAANKGNAVVKAAPGKVADGVQFDESEDE